MGGVEIRLRLRVPWREQGGRTPGLTPLRFMGVNRGTEYLEVDAKHSIGATSHSLFMYVPCALHCQIATCNIMLNVLLVWVGAACRCD